MNQSFIQHLHLLIRCCGCHSSLDLWMNQKFTFTDYVRRRYLLLSKNIWSEINKSEHLQETQLDWRLSWPEESANWEVQKLLGNSGQPGQPAGDTQPAGIHADGLKLASSQNREEEWGAREEDFPLSSGARNTDSGANVGVTCQFTRTHSVTLWLT